MPDPESTLATAFKEWSTDLCYNMGEACKHTKLKKPDQSIVIIHYSMGQEEKGTNLPKLSKCHTNKRHDVSKK